MDFKKIGSDKYNDYYISTDETTIKFYSSWKESPEPSYNFILSVDKDIIKDAINEFNLAEFIVDSVKKYKKE